MADGEHLSEQTRRLWTKDTKGPLEGTEKHPQGRLFAPVGNYTGDPWKLAPENWLKQSDTPAHSDIITWHGSHEQSLPRSDEYEGRAYDPGEWNEDPHGEWDDEDEEGATDYSTDTKDRPMGEYGSVVGMHFGDIEAAEARGGRPYLHPARLPESTLVAPPRSNFSTPLANRTIMGGQHRSDVTVVNKETGERTQDTRWRDTAANYSPRATDFVEEGKAIAYRNDVEARGSTSYRALPETVRTWSEDVMSAKKPDNSGVASKYGWHDDEHAFRNTPHPALVHLAEKGYDPVVETYKHDRYADEYQAMLPFSQAGTPRIEDEHWRNDEVEKRRRANLPFDYNKAQESRQAAFNAGHTFTMRKPT